MLLMSATSGWTQPAAQPSAAPAWQPSRMTDAAQTYTYSRFTLLGSLTNASNEKSGNRPALTLDCIPGSPSHPRGRYLDATLLVGLKLKIVYVEPEEIHGISYYPKVNVRYRVDQAKDETRDQWSAGADKLSVSVPKEVVKQLLRAHSLAISVAADDHGSLLQLKFDMPEPTLVEQACNVDEP
jgi:hypothetical protein